MSKTLIIPALIEGSLSEGGWVIICSTVATFLSLVVKVIADAFTRKADNKERAIRYAEQIEEARTATAASKATEATLMVVHGQINGMKDELVRATGAEKLAEGEKAGRQAEINETAERLVIRERGEDRIAGAVPEADSLDQRITRAVEKAIASGAFAKAVVPESSKDTD